MGKLAERHDERCRSGPVGSKMQRILDRMDDDDRELLLSWLHDDEIGDKRIEGWLRDAGIDVSDSSIMKWRRANGIKTVWAH